jgi:hypothetical protein
VHGSVALLALAIFVVGYKSIAPARREAEPETRIAGVA